LKLNFYISGKCPILISFVCKVFVSMKYLFVTLFVCLSLSLNAQQNHFIYIQADNKQPFYVKQDKKILSSSASGYLIIPKLQTGAYNLVIGFPMNEWPEQNLVCTIGQVDVGYLLKNFGEKGWGLFNFQTMDLVMANNSIKTDTLAVKEKKEDPFASVLSEVVNDPTIKTVDELKEAVKKDSVNIPKKQLVKALVKKTPKPVSKIPAKDMAGPGKDRIKKIAARKNAGDLKMVYVDIAGGKADTINVELPAVKKTVVAKSGADSLSMAVNKKPLTIKQPAVKPKPKKKLPELKPDIAKTDPVKETILPRDTIIPVVVEKEPQVVIASPVKVDSSPVVPAVDTTAIVQSEKIKEEIKPDLVKTDSVVALPVTDTAVVVQAEKKTEETKPAEVKVDSVVTPPLTDTAVVVQAEKKTEETKPAEVKADTVVVAPVTDTTAIVQVEKKPEEIKVDPVPVVSDSSNIEKKAVVDTVVTEKMPGSINLPEKQVENITQADKVVSSPKPRTVCKEAADGERFLSLRKKMAKGSSDNEMLYQAHKEFTRICYTSKQIERLCLLFTTDEGRYKFLDDAYQFVYDPENFAALQSLLSDDYYIKRFKAMLR